MISTSLIKETQMWTGIGSEFILFGPNLREWVHWMWVRNNRFLKVRSEQGWRQGGGGRGAIGPYDIRFVLLFFVLFFACQLSGRSWPWNTPTPLWFFCVKIVEVGVPPPPLSKHPGAAPGSEWLGNQDEDFCLAQEHKCRGKYQEPHGWEWFAIFN